MTIEGRRVLVTGGSGFIASHLVRRLLRRGARVAVLTKYDSVFDNVRLASVWERITVIEADLRNADSLRLVARWKPAVVYHFAAYNHVGDSFTHVSEALDSNAKGTANLMEAYGGYERFVYISTSEVYGDQGRVPFRETMEPRPISPYAVGKYAGELFARMKRHVEGLPVVVLRPFNAFGPAQSPRAVVAETILNALRGRPIATTSGRQTREFNYVDNLVDGFLLAAERPAAVGEVINLASGREVPIRDLVRAIHRLTGERSRLEVGRLPDRPTEIWRMKGAAGKARRLLGWAPRVSFEEGLRRTVDWYRRFLAVWEGRATVRVLDEEAGRPPHRG